MWTYFVLFLSALVLLVVFVRRVVLFARKDKKKAVKEEKEVVENVKQEKLSRTEALKLRSLVEEAEKKIRYGKEDEAIKLFVQALAINQLHEETQHKLAMLYMQKEMFGAAAALFEQLGKQTEDAVHYSHLGFALYKQNKLIEAREAYGRAVLLDDGRPQRFISLGQIYRAMEQPQNAAIAVHRAVEVSEEDNLDFLFLLADIYYETGKLEKAQVFLEKLLELDPEDEEAKKLLKTVKKKLKTD